MEKKQRKKGGTRKIGRSKRAQEIMKIVKETKYMNFGLFAKKEKTNVYHIINKKTDDMLGIIIKQQ